MIYATFNPFIWLLNFMIFIFLAVKKVKIILPMGFFVIFLEFLWKFQYHVF